MTSKNFFARYNSARLKGKIEIGSFAQCKLYIEWAIFSGKSIKKPRTTVLGWGVVERPQSWLNTPANQKFESQSSHRSYEHDVIDFRSLSAAVEHQPERVII